MLSDINATIYRLDQRCENFVNLPTWNRFDAGARHGFQVAQKDLTLRVNLENIANKALWASANGSYLIQGDPRLVKFSATIDC